MFCDNCGREIADTASQCPFCGTLTDYKPSYMYPDSYQVQQHEQGGPSAQTVRQADFSSFGGPRPTPYQAGYRAEPPIAQRGPYNSFPQQVPGYRPDAYAPYYPQTHVTVVQTTQDNTPIIAEIILSLFGLFGVGWILGGEVTTGVILLVCSIFVYWPIMILGTVFTFGIGLICLGPLAIGAIILNALLCNHFLKRRAARILSTQTVQHHQPMQPPFQRPQ